MNVEEVLARVRDGEGFLAATQSLLSDPDAELLARLSIPRRLDRGVAEALTEDPQALERAIGLGAVEATGRGSYRLVPSIRDLHFARRWADPSGGPASAELVELSVRLTEYYTAHGDDVEALYHQFVFAPAAAFAHFLKLFEEADSRSDLARCRDLLEACGDRRSLLSGPNDSERWDSLRAHLDTRSYWIDDWYRSSRFLQPESTREPVAQLLADGPGGALQLYAQGGSGKSMHIRWLIARRCVADGIACARIDFDAVDLAAAIDEPWLIPLALAEQLNRQLRGAPFTAMLKEADFDPERLWRHIGFGDGPADHRFRPTQTSDITSEASRFAAELGALNSGERVLLVLDTLEAPLDPRWVPGGRELVGTVLAALGAAQRAAPNLHVLVAGRFDLRTVFDDFEQLLPNVQTHRLGGFTPDEADRYLRDRRHLESEAHIAAAIEGLTTGDGEIVPFKLALVADVIEHEPALKPEEIVAYSRHDLLYLIKRVVERIDPAVRWVLRYGVFPRILNLEFVREAMQPFLKEAMSQRVGDDDLSADELPGGMPTAEELWSSDLVTADGEVDIDTLWSRLCAYAGDASWVGFDHSAGQQVLRFHPDVVEPMRELVRDKGVAARLHRSAAEWFETQAARHSENPEYATRMLTEALYHRTQLDGAAVLGYWRARMASPIAVNNPDMRRQLARELISTAPSPPAVAEASLEYAWASAQAVAWRLGSLSGDAQAALDRATGLAIYLDPDRLTLVRAAVAIAGGRAAECADGVRGALHSDQPLSERLWLAVSYCAAVENDDPDAARAVYTEALGLSEPQSAEWIILMTSLSGLEVHQDRTELGVSLAEQASRTSGPHIVSGARTQLAIAMLANCQADAAIAVASEGKDDDPTEFTRGLLIQIAGYIELLRPDRALAAAAVLTERLAQLPEDTFVPRVRLQLSGEAAELAAQAHAVRMDYDQALEQLAQASELWRRVGQNDLVRRCRLRRAELQIRELGNLSEAALELSTIVVEPGIRDPSFELLAAELDDRRGYHQSAQAHLDTAFALLRNQRSAPSRLIRAAVTAMSLETGAAGGQFVELLCQELANVDAPQRRLALLRGLRRCRGPLGGSTQARRRLRELVPATADLGHRVGPRGRAVLGLIDADLDRCLGLTEDAQATVGSLSVAALLDDHDLVSTRAWLEVALGTGLQVPALDWLPVAVSESGPYPQPAPLVRAAVAILGATAADANGPIGRHEELLGAASRVLDAGRVTAGSWQARLHRGLVTVYSDIGEPDLAQRHADLAIEVLQRLGDEPAARRLSLSSGGAPAPEQPESATTLIALAVAHETLDVSVTTPGGSRGRSARLSDTHLGRVLSSPDLFGLDGARLLLDPEALGREMGLAVFPDSTAMTALAPTGDVSLRIGDARLAALPWELMHGPRGTRLTEELGTRFLYRAGPSDRLDVDDVLAIQRALRAGGSDTSEDGILGRDTRDELARFQGQAGLPPTGTPDACTEQRLLSRLVSRDVAVLKSSGGLDAMSSRTYRQSQLPTEAIYDGQQFKCWLYDAPSLPVLVKELETHRPAIVHIEAGLLSDSGLPVLDLAGEWQLSESASVDSDRFTATALGDALKKLSVKPIVILDPPAPRSPVELARQLLLRNAFASELSTSGSVRAVVGLGLTSYDAHASMWQGVIAMLAAATPLGELIAAVRRRADETDLLLSALTYGGAALFVRSGEVRPPWAS